MGPLFAYFPFWRQIFWLSYSAWVVFEIWVFSRDRRSVQGRKQDRGSLFFLIGMIILGVTIAFLAPHLVPSAKIKLPPFYIFIASTGFIWVGLGFRFWAILTLGKFFRTSVLVQEQHNLITTGPYHLLRHPSYSGSLLTIFGIGLFMGNWVSALGVLAFALVGYGRRIQVEEEALHLCFGTAFKTQRENTWAIIPFVW